jgi:hypothetical protein
MRDFARFAAFGAVVFASSRVEAHEPNAAAYRYVLSSAKTNLRTDSFSVTDRDLPEIKAGPWSVRKTTLHGGKQEGVELVTIDNGKTTITVVPTRGMSVLEARSGELRLGWNSPVKEVVHPSYVDLDSRGGLGWLDGFSEWMVRCGLEYAGHPGLDEFIDNTGARATMNLTLHGKVGNIPASQVEVLIDREPPHRLRVRGVVHERLFFGPKLELAAEVSTVPGSDTFRIDDAITNRGGGPQEFQLIYHANFGVPILEDGATVLVPAAQVAPMNDHAAKSIEQYGTYAGPTAGFIEQVYLVNPLSDERGTTSVLLRNAAKDRAASMTWSTAALPYMTIWKNTAAEADGYVTGLEPATGFPFNRKVERQFGRVPKLAPGETRRFTLDVGLHASREAVSAVAERIAAIQKGHTPRIETKPPSIAH